MNKIICVKCCRDLAYLTNDETFKGPAICVDCANEVLIKGITPLVGEIADELD